MDYVTFDTPQILAQTGLDQLGVPDWTLMGYWCAALAAIGWSALQYGLIRSKIGVATGIVLLIAATLLSTFHQFHSLERGVLILFMILAAIGCVGFTTLREPVYAALGFATAILSGCGVLFMQQALFVSAATMIVYAGATIIIFLFVLMFAQREYLQTYDLRFNRPYAAALVCTVLFGLLYYSICNTSIESAQPATLLSRPNSVLVDNVPSTAALGRSMYTDYLFTVEVAGTLLLVATIGAIGVAARSAQTDNP